MMELYSLGQIVTCVRELPETDTHLAGLSRNR
jgi:hypothetical protein